MQLDIARVPTTNEMENGSSYTLWVHDRLQASDAEVEQFLVNVNDHVEAKARKVFGHGFISMNQMTKQPASLDLTLEVGIEWKQVDAFKMFVKWVTSLRTELEATSPT